jgi:hypothetical protein
MRPTGWLLATTFVVASLATAGDLPASARADATIAPPNVYSTAPGLPDGRVYEQVSPVDKNGNEAGAGTNHTNETVGAALHYSLAAPDGNAVLFEGTGPMGESTAGYDALFIAKRTSTGWTTRAALPREEIPTPPVGTLGVQPTWLDPSSDLTHLLFGAYQMTEKLPDQCLRGDQLYLGAVEPPAFEWIVQPEIANPVLACGAVEGEEDVPVGGSPDFSTVYFTTPKTLLPEDASRAPHVVEVKAFPAPVTVPWGFYEYSDGVLSEAGVLPDGSLSQWGAVPAASGHGRDVNDHQVSADGSRAFFVSPDPASCTTNKPIIGGHEFRGENNCAVDPPELYVRESGEKTVLVSQDTMIRSSDGLPVGAADGVVGFSDTSLQHTVPPTFGQSFVYASPDGSQAFFESEDRLTRSAPEGPPGNTAPKMYDFDVNTGSLTYLPGVVGEIAASNTDGSSFVFVSPEASAASAELELWSAGPNGGTVTPITQMTGEVHTPNSEGLVGPDVPVARVSDDGSVVVFMTRQQLPGAFNSASGLEQIYRYDAPANTLNCVSCAPAGVTPTSSAEMSVLKSHEEDGPLEQRNRLVEERGVSSDGDRIFFDTADPLVPQDLNTGDSPFSNNAQILEPGGRDVYEWENGVVYLISGGKSPNNSYFLDSSENGDDVFFATSEGLVPGDTDGAYDVYDARVPHPGDNPATAVPCEGSVCQGPPNVPSPLTPPASATFSGLGNLAPEPAAKPAVKPRPKSKPAKCRNGFRRDEKKNKCVKNKAKKVKAKKASNERRVG